MEWFTLIASFLQPLLLKCHDKTSSEDPQEYLRSSYDSVTGRMERHVVEDAIPATRRSVRKARQQASREDRRSFPRYSRNELYDLAEKTLIESMNAPPEAVGAARARAAGLPEDEE